MRKVFNIWFLLMALVAMTSCQQEIEDLFDKSSSERIDDAIDNSVKILSSASNGWVMEYYGGSQYGGYNVICKFKPNGEVTVASEAGKPDATFTSHYKIEQSQGVILSFDSHNPLIHFYSDPHNPNNIGDDGKGMNGDFEFRVLKAAADSVILVGKKHGARILMTPMAKDMKWDAYLKKIAEVEKAMRFKFYNFVVNKDAKLLSPSYRSFAIPNEVDGNTVDVICNYIVTPKGLKFYKPYTINGKTLTGFKYTNDGKFKFPESVNSEVSLNGIIIPLSQQVVSLSWHMKFSTMGKVGRQFWNKMSGIQEQLGEDLKSTALGKSNGKFGFVFISGKYQGCMYMDYKIIDDTHIQLWGTGKGDGNGGWYAKNALFYNYVAPFGWGDVKRTFKIEGDDLQYTTELILTDVDNPDNVIHLYSSKISNPLDH